MLHGDSVGLLAGAVALGAIHGIEPGHGWPVAASYALDRANKWVYGLAASLIIGVGHLLSSIAMVAVFFYAKGYFDLTQVDDPISVFGGVRIGGPLSIVAGIVLVALGVREYRHGHAHAGSDQVGSGRHGPDDGPAHEHEVDDGTGREAGTGPKKFQNPGHDGTHEHHHAHGQTHTHSQTGSTRWTRIVGSLPFAGGHDHDHDVPDEAAERGLLGIAWFAFALGFAHEEEFEIIALCAGSTHCLELMTAYALTVILGIVGLTMLLIAGYQHAEETVEAYTPYLPAFSAAVLILMGVGFVLGLF